MFILCSTLFSDNFNKVEDLFYKGDILEAQILIETIYDKNEDIYYLGYQIYMKLDDLTNANKYLQKAIELKENKYIDENDQLGELINDLKNANKTLTSGFINEAIEESKVLINKYKDNSICYYRLGYAYKENKDFDYAIINFISSWENINSNSEHIYLSKVNMFNFNQ